MLFVDSGCAPAAARCNEVEWPGSGLELLQVLRWLRRCGTLVVDQRSARQLCAVSRLCCCAHTLGHEWPFPIFVFVHFFHALAYCFARVALC